PRAQRRADRLLLSLQRAGDLRRARGAGGAGRPPRGVRRSPSHGVGERALALTREERGIRPGAPYRHPERSILFPPVILSPVGKEDRMTGWTGWTDGSEVPSGLHPEPG